MNTERPHRRPDTGAADRTGVRRGPAPDRVLATVLFTDIVGSTERAARAGDYQWRDLLDRHNALVRRVLGHFRGREVDTAGDGFLATFDGPARAVKCARHIADTVPGVGLELRSGLRTGEIELAGDHACTYRQAVMVHDSRGPGEPHTLPARGKQTPP